MPTQLSNCYVPAPLSSQTGSLSHEKEADKPDFSKRDDGNGKVRSARGLRRILLQSNIFPSAAGSAHIEVGHTKVVCKVLGPVSARSSLVPSSANVDMDQGTLHWDVRYCTHVGYPVSRLLQSTVSSVDQSNQPLASGKINSWTMAREADLAARLDAALAAVVPLRQYPQTVLVVQLTILQDDGSVLPACIAAASLALADATVELLHLVTAGTVAKLPDQGLVVDPTLDEMQYSEALVTIATAGKDVTLWAQAGRLTADETSQAMDLCRQGCRTIHKFLREHLINRKR